VPYIEAFLEVITFSGGRSEVLLQQSLIASLRSVPDLVLLSALPKFQMVQWLLNRSTGSLSAYHAVSHGDCFSWVFKYYMVDNTLLTFNLVVN
jgi:hypothetical protein